MVATGCNRVAEIISLDSFALRARVASVVVFGAMLFALQPSPCFICNEEKFIMKSATKFSAWVIFAALLCFAPCALAEGVVNVKTNRVGNDVLNHSQTVPLNVRGIEDQRGQLGIPKLNSDAGWGNRGGGWGWGWGGGGNGWGGNGWGGNGNGNGGGGTPVPEGGTTLMYLSLAGLSCFGAVMFRARRQLRS
jgi:hypothetical protein